MFDYNNRGNGKQVKETVPTWSQNCSSLKQHECGHGVMGGCLHWSQAGRGCPSSLPKFTTPDFCWVEPLRTGDPAGILQSETLAAPPWGAVRPSSCTPSCWGAFCPLQTDPPKSSHASLTVLQSPFHCEQSKLILLPTLTPFGDGGISWTLLSKQGKAMV